VKVTERVGFKKKEEDILDASSLPSLIHRQTSNL